MKTTNAPVVSWHAGLRLWQVTYNDGLVIRATTISELPKQIAWWFSTMYQRGALVPRHDRAFTPNRRNNV